MMSRRTFAGLLAGTTAATILGCAGRTTGSAADPGSAGTFPSGLRRSRVVLYRSVGEELAHTSIRFGIGRFNTAAEVDYVLDLVVASVERLRTLSPLWEMHQDGIDISSIQWTPH